MKQQPALSRLLAFGLAVVCVCAIGVMGGTLVGAQGTGKVLFQDDFSTPSTAWWVGARNGYEFAYAGGTYHIRVSPTSDLPMSLLGGHQYDNASIEVDTVRTGGKPNDTVGVVCRSNPTDHTYILLGISDGAPIIVKGAGSNLKELAAAKPSPAVLLLEGATNHLRADCVGSTFTLYANGQKLLQASDPDYKTGQAGLFVSRLANVTGTVDFGFDSFVVRQPAQ